MERRAVITGVGVISALGDSPAELYAALCAGRSGLKAVEPNGAFEVGCRQAGRLDSFAVRTYLKEGNIYPLDRFAQLVTSAAQLALDDSGWTADARAANNVGVALGTMFACMSTHSQFDRSVIVTGPGSVRALDFTNCALNSAAGQAAIWHKLRGMNSTIMACIPSGLHALSFAAEWIRQGRVTAILAGGAEELCPESFYALAGAGLLCNATDGAGEYPVPFDARRNGFAPAEGVALLMLEEASAAEARGARILAEIEGCAGSYDCSRAREDGSSITHIARTINAALAEADVRPEQIDAVSASANGSPADHKEAQAIAEVFGRGARTLPVTAIKSMLGETLGASGPLQAVAMLEAMRGGVLPGIRHLHRPEENFPLGGALGNNQQVEMRRALVNSVGLDGSCSALVLARRD
jgi:3-oxoacyl-[acyl-carrier-protein] synthase II